MWTYLIIIFIKNNHAHFDPIVTCHISYLIWNYAHQFVQIWMTQQVAATGTKDFQFLAPTLGSKLCSVSMRVIDHSWLAWKRNILLTLSNVLKTRTWGGHPVSHEVAHLWKEQVCNLWVLLEPTLSLEATVARCAFFQLRLVHQLCPLFDREDFGTPCSGNVQTGLLQWAVHEVALEDYLWNFSWSKMPQPDYWLGFLLEVI